jgi:transcriptional regulator with XRE-family HTH domain
MTPAQCRAARGLIRWTQPDLAKAAGVSDVTVRKFETEQSIPQRASLEVIRRALEAAGVEFIAENGGGAGVRLRKPILHREIRTGDQLASLCLRRLRSCTPGLAALQAVEIIAKREKSWTWDVGSTGPEIVSPLDRDAARVMINQLRQEYDIEGEPFSIPIDKLNASNDE